MVSHPGLVSFQVLGSLVHFCADRTAVLTLGVWVKLLVRHFVTCLPECSNRIPAPVGLQEMPSLPFWLSVAASLYEEPSSVDVAEHIQNLLHFVIFFRCRVLVSAAGAVNEHALFLLEDRRTEIAFKLVLLHICDHFLLCDFAGFRAGHVLGKRLCHRDFHVRV